MDLLKDFKQQIENMEEKDRKWKKEMDELVSALKEKSEEFLPWEYGLIKARKKDYVKWLISYLSQGGEITHVYDRDFSEHESFYTATRDFELGPRYGSESKNVIIPVNVKTGSAKGHNCYYKMEGPKPQTEKDRLNKWCVRECERSSTVEDNKKFDLPDFT